MMFLGAGEQNCCVAGGFCVGDRGIAKQSGGLGQPSLPFKPWRTLRAWREQTEEVLTETIIDI
jgi:hypothetical protein